jgi:hypothetical protein
VIEKRLDAQLARQYDMALPDELPIAERIEAVRRFAAVIVEAGSRSRRISRRTGIMAMSW